MTELPQGDEVSQGDGRPCTSLPGMHTPGPGALRRVRLPGPKASHDASFHKVACLRKDQPFLLGTQRPEGGRAGLGSKLTDPAGEQPLPG